MTFKKIAKVLLLGSSGKMGLALLKTFKEDYHVVCKNSSNFNAYDFKQIRTVIEEHKPDIVLNTIALLGVDCCEKEPEKAFRLNTFYPKCLAGLAKEKGFLLVHFSTDAVFNNSKKDFYVESDTPAPLNVYGLSKYGGDCFIQALAEKYYLIRVSLLFGQSTKNTQFVEKMLLKIKEGASVLRIADDIMLSPTYSDDVAQEVKRLIESSFSYGLYHIVNEGKASLYDLMNEIIINLCLDVRLERASYKEFPSIGIKNTFTPLTSEKTGSLRPWQPALKTYCEKLVLGKIHGG